MTNQLIKPDKCKGPFAELADEIHNGVIEHQWGVGEIEKYLRHKIIRPLEHGESSFVPFRVFERLTDQAIQAARDEVWNTFKHWQDEQNKTPAK